MGIVFDQVVFDAPAPALSRIVAKVTEMTGLPLTFKDSNAEVKGNLYDLHAQVAITGMPSSELHLSSYRPGAVKEWADEVYGESGSPVVPFVQGHSEPPGTQVVYLTGCVSSWPTLFRATLLALEALGGRLTHPITEEDRRLYGGPTTVAQVRARERKLAWQMLPAMLLGCLLLPVVLPLTILWAVVSVPWTIWRAYRLLREWERQHPRLPDA